MLHGPSGFHQNNVVSTSLCRYWSDVRFVRFSRKFWNFLLHFISKPFELPPYQFVECCGHGNQDGAPRTLEKTLKTDQKVFLKNPRAVSRAQRSTPAGNPFPHAVSATFWVCHFPGHSVIQLRKFKNASVLERSYFKNAQVWADTRRLSV